MCISVSNVLSGDNKRNDGRNDEGCSRAILKLFTLQQWNARNIVISSLVNRNKINILLRKS